MSANTNTNTIFNKYKYKCQQLEIKHDHWSSSPSSSERIKGVVITLQTQFKSCASCHRHNVMRKIRIQIKIQMKIQIHYKYKYKCKWKYKSRYKHRYKYISKSTNITLAHTILVCYPQENQATGEENLDMQTIRVGLGGSRLQWIFSDKCKQKAICSAVAHQKVWIFF